MGLAAVIAVASVAPHDAKTNLAAWWSLTGGTPPSWLQHPRIDGQVIVGALVLLVVWALGRFLLRDKPESPATYMTLYEAAHYLADESDWGRKIRLYAEPFEHKGKSEVMRKYPLYETHLELAHESAKEHSKVRVFGRKPEANEAGAIPHTFWMTNTPNPIACWISTGVNDQTGPGIYTDLKFDREGVIRTWPRVMAWRRAKAILASIGRKIRGK